MKTPGEHTLSNRLATLRPTRQLDCREAARHPIAASISRKQAGTSVPHFPIMLVVKQECLGKSRCECQGATPNHIGCVRRDSISADPQIRKIRDRKQQCARISHRNDTQICDLAPVSQINSMWKIRPPYGNKKPALNYPSFSTQLPKFRP